MAGVTYEAARSALEARLTRSGIGHSVAVGDEAARLAGIYGVDAEKARLAGLLHDWSRDVDRESLLERARNAGVPVTPVDEAVPYLLHAEEGARELREAFPGLDPDIVQAVARHTLGSPDMTPLDMVVYLADMTEPGRTFDGVEHLRELVGEVPLWDLYGAAYAASICYLVKSRKRLHPRTAESWNAIVAEESR